MITQHPEVEKKVLAELDSHGLLVTPERPNPRPLEWDDLGKLSYTNNCIKVRLGPACMRHCIFLDLEAAGRWYACRVSA